MSLYLDQVDGESVMTGTVSSDDDQDDVEDIQNVRRSSRLNSRVSDTVLSELREIEKKL